MYCRFYQPTKGTLMFNDAVNAVRSYVIPTGVACTFTTVAALTAWLLSEGK